MSWPAIAVLVLGAYGFKALGVFGLSRLGAGGDVADASTGLLRWFPILAALIPAALFAALIAVQTLEAGGALQVDARLAGVTASGVAVWRKAPFIAAIAVAMAVTALIRWQTSG